jgi:HTH-type transcriptional regulator / antitoxin HigA
MMDIKILKTEKEYEATLQRIEALMDAEPGSAQEEELELLTLLVEKFEEEHYPIDPPDPVEAILFRMDQQGLTAKDMIQYLGSQSKVSEVLNRKRPLSLTMIRNLYEGLDIPSEVLLRQPNPQAEEAILKWQDFPFTQMVKCGYFSAFDGTLAEARKQSGRLLADLFSVFQKTEPALVWYKQLQREVNDNALKAWQARIAHMALDESLPAFSRDEFSEKFLRQVVKLSYFNDGPRLAKELLNKKGIHLFFLPNLPKTYLDGACFYAPDRRPVIGMTLRYDRLDNYWFTLLHELSHLYLNLDDRNLAFFDDTEQLLELPQDGQEQEANEFAKEMLLPSQAWEQIKSCLNDVRAKKVIAEFAEQYEVNPAIIAGRARWEAKNYTLFSNMVGSRQVREKFPEYVCQKDGEG